MSGKQSGKLQLSPAKIIELEMETARHLGSLKSIFEKLDFVKENMGNSDETQFVLILENGNTLGFSGDE